MQRVVDAVMREMGQTLSKERRREKRPHSDASSVVCRLLAHVQDNRAFRQSRLPYSKHANAIQSLSAQAISALKT